MGTRVSWFRNLSEFALGVLATVIKAATCLAITHDWELRAASEELDRRVQAALDAGPALGGTVNHHREPGAS